MKRRESLSSLRHKRYDLSFKFLRSVRTQPSKPALLDIRSSHRAAGKCFDPVDHIGVRLARADLDPAKCSARIDAAYAELPRHGREP